VRACECGIEFQFDLAQFHGDVLRFFIPKRLFEKLKQFMFGRVQRKDESFSSYVNSVKDAAVVLQLPVSENEIVSNIVEGLNPTQRSRFVFKLLSDNLAALDRL
jgi:stress-induced morphogen